MSAADLARAAGVSKATISSVERGLGNPAVDTVWALAEALGLPFGALFDDEGQDLVQVRHLDDARVVSKARGFLGRQVVTLPRHGQIELYVLQINGGARRNAAPHSAGVIEHVIVMEGKAEVGPDDEPSVVEARDYIRFRADRPHHYHGIDNTLLLLLTEYPS